MINSLFSNFMKIEITPISFQFYLCNKLVIEVYSSLLESINQFYIEFYSFNSGAMNILINDMNCSSPKKIVPEDEESTEDMIDPNYPRNIYLGHYD